MIVFERAGLLFIFNCTLVPPAELTVVHPTQSFTDYRVGVEVAGEYKVVLTSDERRFGGHDRIDMTGKYFTNPMEWNNRKNFLQVSCSTFSC